MNKRLDNYFDIPFYIPKSHVSTMQNKTGTWRFARPIYQEKLAPCSTACPASENIPKIEYYLSQGLIKNAWETILYENPFPSICGRVCFHNCEKECNRGSFDESLSVHNIERFIGDKALSENFEQTDIKLPLNNKKIAIVGSGPAGLSAGYFLSILGYNCHIFEQKNSPGGLLRWGIPEYRLPKDILDKEIARIENDRLKIFLNQEVSKSFINDANGAYDAIFLACGLGKTAKMNITGEEMCIDGLKFLEKVSGGINPEIKGNVAVIGGGNTAIDVSRVLLRLNAKPSIIYRRRKQDMPAFSYEVNMACEEGVIIHELLSPLSINKENKYVLEVLKMKIDGISNGRMQVISDENQKQTLEFDHIISATGSKPLKDWYMPDDNRKMINLSHIVFSNKDIPVLYGGDLTNQILSVTDAIASGKQAAIALDIFFENGFSNILETFEKYYGTDKSQVSMEAYLKKNEQKNTGIVFYKDLNVDYFEKQARVNPKKIDKKESISSFKEIEQTYDDNEVLTEVIRCINCGICNQCDNCRIFCPELAIDFTNNERVINYDYCKGCGICIVECPRNAMSLEEEK